MKLKTIHRTSTGHSGYVCNFTIDETMDWIIQTYGFLLPYTKAPIVLSQFKEIIEKEMDAQNQFVVHALKYLEKKTFNEPPNPMYFIRGIN